jgi:hypothetical protein
LAEESERSRGKEVARWWQVAWEKREREGERERGRERAVESQRRRAL